MPSEDIVTRLRILGQSQYVQGMLAAATAAKNLEGAQTRVARASEHMGGRLDQLTDSVGRMGARLAGVAVVTGASLAKIGLQFDAMIERSEIGIETLVGSAGQARRITADVRKFALEAPLFGTEQMIKTAQQLIGAGYDAKNIVPYLETFSDTLSAMGRKPEDLQRMTYAFVQMMSKGQISAEELRGQLGEIFPAQRLLAEEMGLTTDEFAKKMKKGSIKGKDAILLLFRAMEREYGGATERMAKTFDGQLANIKESAKMTLGVVFRPLFLHLRDDVFPMVQLFGEHWTAVMNDNSLTAKEKWQKTKDYANAWLKPIFTNAGRWIEEADIGTKIGDAMETALPIMAEAFGKAGFASAKVFGKAFVESDFWGKVFLGLLAARLVGLKWGTVMGPAGRVMGRVLGRATGRGGGGAGGMGGTGTMNVTAGVVNVYGGAGPGAPGAPGGGKPGGGGWRGRAGRILRSPVTRGFGALGAALTAAEVANIIRKDVERNKREVGRKTAEEVRKGASQTLKGFVPLSGVNPSMARSAPNLAPGQPNFPTFGLWDYNKKPVLKGDINVTVKSVIDGREVGRAVAKQSLNESNRR